MVCVLVLPSSSAAFSVKKVLLNGQVRASSDDLLQRLLPTDLGGDSDPPAKRKAAGSASPATENEAAVSSNNGEEKQ